MGFGRGGDRSEVPVPSLLGGEWRNSPTCIARCRRLVGGANRMESGVAGPGMPRTRKAEWLGQVPRYQRVGNRLDHVVCVPIQLTIQVCEVSGAYARWDDLVFESRLGQQWLCRYQALRTIERQRARNRSFGTVVVVVCSTTSQSARGVMSRLFRELRRNPFATLRHHHRRRPSAHRSELA